MATIPLIQNPPFNVDYQRFIDRKKVEEISTTQKVVGVISRPFELIVFIFIATVKSGSTVLSYSWISFKHNVLGYYGSLSKFKPPSDFYLVMFKVVIWSFGVFWCFTTTALRLLVDQISPPSRDFLNAYTEGKIDTAHLRTQEQAIDMSAVPVDVQVDTLMTFFDEINFSDESKPGYMPHTSRKEGKTIYEVAQLKEGLQTFIQNVKNRVAFLGTPPAHDTPRLMAFYQQIEDAIRFSLHKVNQDFTTFQDNNGSDVEEYNAKQMQRYKDLLENKARLAIDMAIAGKHCGARFMGEAMSTYMAVRGEGVETGTLQDCLIELLATKRSEIAQRQVTLHLGSNVHDLTNYMASLGQPLGLPGTQNVVEHLSDSLDQDQFIRLFFGEYTVDLIIDTVQEKIKKSNNFRDKIYEWLKNQVGEWKKDENEVQECLGRIQQILNREEKAKKSEELEQFGQLLEHLREKKVEWPKDEGWDNFIDEIFALDETKAWLQEDRQKKNRIIVKLKGMKPFREAIINGGELPEENGHDKIKDIQKVLRIEADTLSRILKGEVKVEEVVRDYLDLERRNQFIEELQLEKIADVGVSPALLEWLLVSQEILLPQEVS